MKFEPTRLFRLALALGLLLGAAGATAAETAYRLHVAGLSCPFCAYGLEKRLGKLDGVRGIEIDLADGAVRVTMAEGTTLDEATARQAVKKAGFTLDDFTVENIGPDAPDEGE